MRADVQVNAVEPGQDLAVWEGREDAFLRPYWNINSYRTQTATVLALIQPLSSSLAALQIRQHHYTMDRYPCVNRYKHGVDCPSWVNVHGARCEDCVVYNR
ncbi:hypothetical protein LZ31DRAFT_601023 [Colletotrichum somersetense]|nr:hypothetical protein LZ31DRAFT_601023 [Colletotrichum somersetense]